MLSLAEAFLRIPDNTTADALIREKIVGMDWKVLKNISGSKYISALATAASYAEKLIINEDSIFIYGDEDENQLIKKILSEPR